MNCLLSMVQIFSTMTKAPRYLFALSLCILSSVSADEDPRRGLLNLGNFKDPKTVVLRGATQPFNGIENSEWCKEPAEPPIPYDDCQFNAIMFRFGVYGGLTNALHFILKGAIWAMQEHICFYITENGKFSC